MTTWWRLLSNNEHAEHLTPSAGFPMERDLFHGAAYVTHSTGTVTVSLQSIALRATKTRQHIVHAYFTQSIHTIYIEYFNLPPSYTLHHRKSSPRSPSLLICLSLLYSLLPSRVQQFLLSSISETDIPFFCFQPHTSRFTPPPRVQSPHDATAPGPCKAPTWGYIREISQTGFKRFPSICTYKIPSYHSCPPFIQFTSCSRSCYPV